MLVLWGHDRLQRATLPTAVDEVWVADHWPDDAELRCQARCVQQLPLETRWDLSWTGPDGQVLAVLRGVHMHVLPEPAAQA